jgi:hypothetical protein
MTVEKLELFVNEFVLVLNSLDPTKNRYEFGPAMVELQDGWEYFFHPGLENEPKAARMQLSSVRVWTGCTCCLYSRMSCLSRE